MKRQSSTTKGLALGVTLTVLLLQLASSQAAPHHTHQQQQLLYYNHVTPPQQRQSANVVILPGNGAGIQQFAAAGVPLPVGGQYLLVQPGANPVLYVTRTETGDKPVGGNEDKRKSFISEIFNTVSNLTNSFTSVPSIPGIGSSETNKTDTQPTEKPAGFDKPDKPIKVEEGQTSSSAESSEKQSASLEKFDEDAPSSKPAAPAVPTFIPAPGQRFVVVGQPQFFGNFDALRNHAVRQELGTNGAVSSFLLLKNQEVIPLASAANGKLQEEAGNSVAQVPGASALEFQKFLSVAKQRQTQDDVANVAFAPLRYQNVVYVARQPPQQNPAASSAEDSASITVDALKIKSHVRKEGEEGADDSEDIEANPPGPSVAQVTPQAIALAGPGGVASAAPRGTAVVGPGGLAMAAPSATAVAGPSGGAPPPPGAHASAALSSPAAYKAYLLEQQAKGSYPFGSYHVAYNA